MHNISLLKIQSLNKFSVVLISFLFNLIKCQKYYPEPDQDDKRKEDEFEEYKNLMSESVIKLTIINVLIGTNIFFLIIILSILIYEIINCCHRKKIEALLINNSKNKKLIIINNQSNLNISEENIPNVKSSFNSSKVLENMKSNNEEYNNSNNSMQRPPNPEEYNNSMERSNDGYEAPLVNNISNKNNEEKFLTNNGEDNRERKKFHLLENPY